MQLHELGEFGLIDQIRKRFEGSCKSSLTGIGDDCAVIPKNERESSLVTCDTLIEKIHFLNNGIEPEDLGYKSLAVSISDIAAMGGKAEYAFLSLAMPGVTSCEWITRYLDGFHEFAGSEGVVLLGGDTTKSPEHMAITITLIGTVDNLNIKRRSGAQPGDVICVTGYLGDSGAGLQLLLENRKMTDEHEHKLVQAHNRPRVYHREGRWLASQKAVHAMIDISDGIASDAAHIAKASGLSLHISTERLPLSESLKITSDKYSWDMHPFAVSSGEDYVLLCTMDARHFNRIQEDFYKKFGIPLFDIGEVKQGHPETVFFDNGKKTSVLSSGYDHFKK